MFLSLCGHICLYNQLFTVAITSTVKLKDGCCHCASCSGHQGWCGPSERWHTVVFVRSELTTG